MSKKLSLFVFIDAFGWEIFKKYDFLQDILTFQRPLGTILGYSSTCDPTILTGKLPREHGHFSFFVYDPKSSPFKICKLFGLLPHSITRRGRVRRMMSKMIGRYYGYTGYFQLYNMPFRHLDLFDYSEKRDLYEKGGINTGLPTIFDYLRQQRIPFHLSNWRRSEEENLKTLSGDLKKGEATFAYLYMAAMDATLHAQGTNGKDVGKKIRWYEEKLRSILKTASEKYESTRIFVFSDHGMTDVTQGCNLMGRIDKLGLRFGKDFVAVYDSTMARFWFFHQEARNRVIGCLQKERQGHIMTEEELHHYGCDFPGQKYGELFFLVDPGVLICPSFMGETMLAGMHGYQTDHQDSIAILLSNVSPDPVPQDLAGMYDLMYKEASHG